MYERVETAEAMTLALRKQAWNVVISDHRMPQLDSHGALRLVQEFAEELPFIIVSGTIGEKAAVAAMKAGAHDYLLKEDLARLVPAVGRELREARTRQERRQAEQALRESEALYQSLVETLPQSIFRKDRAGHFVFCNQHFCDGLGRSWEAIAGKTDADFFPPHLNEAYRQDDLHVMESGQTLEQVEENMGIDGRKTYVQVVKTPLRAPDGTVIGLQGIFWDITDRKRLEEERAMLEAQLHQSARLEAIGTLASGVAHEINNPINGVMNYADLIQSDLPEGSPLHGYAGEIIRETERMATIVRNLLTFARHEPGEQRPTPVREIVEGTLSLIRTVIRKDRIQLAVDLPEKLPVVTCQSQQIQQVLMNLLTNARDALNARHPEHDPDKIMRVSAGAFEQEGESWMRFTVEDHGTGIPPEVRQRMFEPFYTTKAPGKGTGLGMSISLGIVQQHHGELRCETAVDQYTRFHLELPVAGRRESPAAAGTVWDDGEPGHKSPANTRRSPGTDPRLVQTEPLLTT